MKKIRLLIISTSGLYKREGISTVILDYFGEFDKDRFDYSIISDEDSDEGLVLEFQKKGFCIEKLPSRKKSVFKYISALKKLFRKQKYDALYIHGSSAIMSIELKIAKRAGCKVRVVHSHNTTCDHKKADKLLRPFFYRLYTDAFACGTEAGKWLYGDRPFKIVSNGRDIRKYQFDLAKRQKIRTELGASENDLLIGHVGNFNAQKNQAFLVSTFKEVLKIRSDARLYLMGSGKTLDAVKALSKELGVSGRIVFTGSINNVPEMLQAMDVMVLPSLHEGLPLVVVEWQMAGLPCLVSDAVTRECAYTDFVSFKSLNDSYQQWAEEIIRISKNDRAKDAKSAIQLTAKNGFDLSQNAAKLEHYFIEHCSMERNKSLCLLTKD